MAEKCLIISGGEFSKPDFSLIPQICDFDYVIACDKGFEYAQKLHIKPDLVIGDFDSLSESYITQLEKMNNVQRYSTEKDDTDTMLACRIALEKGCKFICIISCFGNRLDHTLANLQAAIFLSEQNAHCYLLGDKDFMTAISNSSITIPKKQGWSLSVFSASDVSEGVSISGAKYSVQNIVMKNSYPLGVSNEFIGKSSEISVREGCLLVDYPRNS